MKVKTSDPWHDDCDLTYRYTNHTTGVRGYWCQLHKQWTYLHPTAETYSYGPESDIVVEK